MPWARGIVCNLDRFTYTPEEVAINYRNRYYHLEDPDFDTNIHDLTWKQLYGKFSLQQIAQVPQRSPFWLLCRSGHVTGSMVGNLLFVDEPAGKMLVRAKAVSEFEQRSKGKQREVRKTLLGLMETDGAGTKDPTKMGNFGRVACEYGNRNEPNAIASYLESSRHQSHVVVDMGFLRITPDFIRQHFPEVVVGRNGQPDIDPSHLPLLGSSVDGVVLEKTPAATGELNISAFRQDLPPYSKALEGTGYKIVGCIECKCACVYVPKDKHGEPVHFQYNHNTGPYKVMKAKHYAQMQFSMLATGTRQCTYVVYTPERGTWLATVPFNVRWMHTTLRLLVRLNEKYISCRQLPAKGCYLLWRDKVVGTEYEQFVKDTAALCSQVKPNKYPDTALVTVPAGPHDRWPEMTHRKVSSVKNYHCKIWNLHKMDQDRFLDKYCPDEHAETVGKAYRRYPLLEIITKSQLLCQQLFDTIDQERISKRQPQLEPGPTLSAAQPISNRAVTALPMPQRPVTTSQILLGISQVPSSTWTLQMSPSMVPQLSQHVGLPPHGQQSLMQLTSSQPGWGSARSSSQRVTAKALQNARKRSLAEQLKADAAEARCTAFLNAKRPKHSDQIAKDQLHQEGPAGGDPRPTQSEIEDTQCSADSEPKLARGHLLVSNRFEQRGSFFGTHGPIFRRAFPHAQPAPAVAASVLVSATGQSGQNVPVANQSSAGPPAYWPAATHDGQLEVAQRAPLPCTHDAAAAAADAAGAGTLVAAGHVGAGDAAPDDRHVGDAEMQDTLLAPDTVQQAAQTANNKLLEILVDKLDELGLLSQPTNGVGASKAGGVEQGACNPSQQGEVAGVSPRRLARIHLVGTLEEGSSGSAELPVIAAHHAVLANGLQGVLPAVRRQGLLIQSNTGVALVDVLPDAAADPSQHPPGTSQVVSPTARNMQGKGHSTKRVNGGQLNGGRRGSCALGIAPNKPPLKIANKHPVFNQQANGLAGSVHPRPLQQGSTFAAGQQLQAEQDASGELAQAMHVNGKQHQLPALQQPVLTMPGHTHQAQQPPRHELGSCHGQTRARHPQSNGNHGNSATAGGQQEQSTHDGHQQDGLQGGNAGCDGYQQDGLQGGNAGCDGYQQDGLQGGNAGCDGYQQDGFQGGNAGCDRYQQDGFQGGNAGCDGYQQDGLQGVNAGCDGYQQDGFQGGNAGEGHHDAGGSRSDGGRGGHSKGHHNSGPGGSGDGDGGDGDRGNDHHKRGKHCCRPDDDDDREEQEGEDDDDEDDNHQGGNNSSHAYGMPAKRQRTNNQQPVSGADPYAGKHQAVVPGKRLRTDNQQPAADPHAGQHQAVAPASRQHMFSQQHVIEATPVDTMDVGPSSSWVNQQQGTTTLQHHGEEGSRQINTVQLLPGAVADSQYSTPRLVTTDLSGGNQHQQGQLQPQALHTHAPHQGNLSQGGQQADAMNPDHMVEADQTMPSLGQGIGGSGALHTSRQQPTNMCDMSHDGNQLPRQHHAQQHPMAQPEEQSAEMLRSAEAAADQAHRSVPMNGAEAGEQLPVNPGQQQQQVISTEPLPHNPAQSQQQMLSAEPLSYQHLYAHNEQPHTTPMLHQGTAMSHGYHQHIPQQQEEQQQQYAQAALQQIGGGMGFDMLTGLPSPAHPAVAQLTELGCDFGYRLGNSRMLQLLAGLSPSGPSAFLSFLCNNSPWVGQPTARQSAVAADQQLLGMPVGGAALQPVLHPGLQPFASLSTATELSQQQHISDLQRQLTEKDRQLTEKDRQIRMLSDLLSLLMPTMLGHQQQSAVLQGHQPVPMPPRGPQPLAVEGNYHQQMQQVNPPFTPGLHTHQQQHHQQQHQNHQQHPTGGMPTAATWNLLQPELCTTPPPPPANTAAAAPAGPTSSPFQVRTPPKDDDVTAATHNLHGDDTPPHGAVTRRTATVVRAAAAVTDGPDSGHPSSPRHQQPRQQRVSMYQRFEAVWNATDGTPAPTTSGDVPNSEAANIPEAAHTRHAAHADELPAMASALQPASGIGNITNGGLHAQSTTRQQNALFGVDAANPDRSSPAVLLPIRRQRSRDSRTAPMQQGGQVSAELTRMRQDLDSPRRNLEPFFLVDSPGTHQLPRRRRSTTVPPVGHQPEANQQSAAADTSARPPSESPAVNIFPLPLPPAAISLTGMHQQAGGNPPVTAALPAHTANAAQRISVQPVADRQQAAPRPAATETVAPDSVPDPQPSSSRRRTPATAPKAIDQAGNTTTAARARDTSYTPAPARHLHQAGDQAVQAVAPVARLASCPPSRPPHHVSPPVQQSRPGCTHAAGSSSNVSPGMNPAAKSFSSAVPYGSRVVPNDQAAVFGAQTVNTLQQGEQAILSPARSAPTTPEPVFPAAQHGGTTSMAQANMHQQTSAFVVQNTEAAAAAAVARPVNSPPAVRQAYHQTAGASNHRQHPASPTSSPAATPPIATVPSSTVAMNPSIAHPLAHNEAVRAFAGDAAVASGSIALPNQQAFSVASPGVVSHGAMTDGLPSSSRGPPPGNGRSCSRRPAAATASSNAAAQNNLCQVPGCAKTATYGVLPLQPTLCPRHWPSYMMDVTSKHNQCNGHDAAASGYMAAGIAPLGGVAVPGVAADGWAGGGYYNTVAGPSNYVGARLPAAAPAGGASATAVAANVDVHAGHHVAASWTQLAGSSNEAKAWYMQNLPDDVLEAALEVQAIDEDNIIACLDWGCWEVLAEGRTPNANHFLDSGARIKVLQLWHDLHVKNKKKNDPTRNPSALLMVRWLLLCLLEFVMCQLDA
eukprot:jgi/Chrzof1/4224/Cz14g03210.t1